MKKRAVAAGNHLTYRINMQYFEIFDLDVNYNIDAQALHDKYLLLQKQYHPDNSTTEFEKREMLQLSMTVNDAYKTLNNDLLRAEYMLAENKHSVLNENSRYQLPVKDLTYFLEMQEEIDNCTDIKVLNKILESIQQKSQEAKNNIAAEWTMRALEEMKYHTCYLKYLSNLHQYLNDQIKSCS